MNSSCFFLIKFFRVHPDYFMHFIAWFKIKFRKLKEKLGVSRTQKEDNRPKKGLRI